MKKVIVFKVEDVLVKDFNREASLKRARSIKKIGMTESEKVEWVDRKERDFYEKEFERSKFKGGIGEILKVLKGMKERFGVNLVFVTDHRKLSVERILWNNDWKDVDVESCDGNWLEKVLEDCGKSREDVILFSNKQSDLESGEELGIKVENFSVESEGMNGFMGKLGLRMCA